MNSLFAERAPIYHVLMHISICGMLLPFAVAAQFAPVALSPESFTHDIVVERTAPVPLAAATTASIEMGLTNMGYSWFEKGYNADWPATGLPPAGAMIASDLTMDHEYQFAPDYRSNNAVLIDSTLTHAELLLVSPAAYASLSFLVSGAHDRGYAPVAYVVHHQNGSTQTGSIRCQDWLDTIPQAFTANGRVNVRTFTFADLNGNLPRLFSADIPLTNIVSPVVRVELLYVSGAGHSFIMAVSGAAQSGGAFGPIAFTGYNVDVVVEATATRAQALIGVTTGTMSTGSGNSLWTWYERGYVPAAMESGLPAAGTLVTNINAPDRFYQLASSYAEKNAALVDSDFPTLNLAPSHQVQCSALSFLTAAAGGAATNQCIVQHLDGSAQTNLLLSPAWTDGASMAALHARGMVNINNRLVDLSASGPCLFAAELELSNSVSPVTNIVLSRLNAGSAARAVFLALSARSGGAEPTRALLSIQLLPGGGLSIRSSAPGRLEFTTRWEGANTAWQSVGPIIETLNVTPAAGEQATFYRVVGGEQ